MLSWAGKPATQLSFGVRHHEQNNMLMTKFIKGAIFSISIIVALHVNGVGNAVPDTYDWFEGADGYDDVFEIAKSEKRPLIVYFHVDWCGYCKYLNEEFLDDSDVDDYISNYLRVKINPEDGEEERDISKRYGVKGYPTFLITHPHLNRVKRVHPFKKGGKIWSTNKFIHEIRLIIGKTSK